MSATALPAPRAARIARPPISGDTFAAALRQGYWYCDRCETIHLEIPELHRDTFNDRVAHCPRCHKPTATWHPPAYV